MKENKIIVKRNIGDYIKYATAETKNWVFETHELERIINAANTFGWDLSIEFI